MSEMPDDIRKIARSYVGHQHRWIGPDEVVTLLANAILIERLAAEKRGKEEERERCAAIAKLQAIKSGRVDRRTRRLGLARETYPSEYGEEIAAAIRGS